MNVPRLSPPAAPASGFPALAGLRLSANDLALLADQGSVAAERRGEHVYYKLFFRRGGRQTTRYIGTAAAACDVNAELERLQSLRRMRREFAALDRKGRRLLRQSKLQLEPLIAASGLKFHGRTIRQPRCAD